MTTHNQENSTEQEEETLKQVTVDRPTLHLLAQQKTVDIELIQFGFSNYSIYISRKNCFFWAYRLFMAAGLLLLLSGIIFFFAYNWTELSKFAKLGLIQASILLIAASIVWTRPPPFITKLSLSALCVLVGLLLAVFGQIYQTGADAYDLFLGWTLLVSLWVLIARAPLLWLFYIFLINCTAILYLGQVRMSWELETSALVIATINSLALLSWEFIGKKNRLKGTALFCIRSWGLVAITDLTVAVFFAIFEGGSFGFAMIHVLMYVGWIIGGYVYYVRNVKDIAFATMISVSILMVVNGLFVRFMIDVEVFDAFFLLLSLGNIAATTLLVIKLVNLHKRWQKNKHKLEQQSQSYG